MREFVRYYLLKVLVVIVVLQLAFFYWLENRNHRPEAVNDEVSVYEGHTVKIRPLRNDTDKDDNKLSIGQVNNPLKGSLKQEDDIFVYTAIKGFAGVDSFTYTVNDGKKESNEAYIKVTVNENLPPEANNDLIVSYPENKIPLLITGNDTDREGDSLFIDNYTTPLYGKIEKENNQLYYIPVKPALKDSFQYTVSDGFKFSKTATVTINIKNKNSGIYPWLSRDIGNPQQKGNVKIKNNELFVMGSGNDIWNNVDNFHYAYQLVEGDFEMVTKALTLENTNQWAKIGIMARESLTGESRNAYMCMSSQNGTNCQFRTSTGSGSISENQRGDIAVPHWLKLVRAGNKFTGYRSPDGKEWIQVNEETLDVPSVIYLGIGVTSHDDSKLCTATIDLSKTKIIKK